MNNLYYNQMVELLLSHPEGMRVGHLSRAIYNANCDLFTPNAASLFRNIHQQVYQYLWREQRKRQSPILRLRWGIYTLRPHFVMQLEFCFDDWDQDVVTHTEKVAVEKPKAYMHNLFDECQ